MWSNYGMTFVEYIFLNRFRKNNSHIEIHGMDHLEELLKDNKPLILFLVILQILSSCLWKSQKKY